MPGDPGGSETIGLWQQGETAATAGSAHSDRHVQEKIAMHRQSDSTTQTAFFINRHGPPFEVVNLADLSMGLVVSRNPRLIPRLEKIIPSCYTFMLQGARIWPIIAHDWPARPLLLHWQPVDEYAYFNNTALITPEGSIAIGLFDPHRQEDGLRRVLEGLPPICLYPEQFDNLLALFYERGPRG